MQLSGVHTPIVTPFDASNGIDYNMLGHVIEFHLENGISGIMPGDQPANFMLSARMSVTP